MPVFDDAVKFILKYEHKYVKRSEQTIFQLILGKLLYP